MKKHSHAIGGLSLCLGFVLALPLASPARGAVKGIAAANAGARCDSPALPLASAAPGAVFTVITAADRTSRPFFGLVRRREHDDLGLARRCGVGKLTLEFFGNDARDHSGFGQGQIPIGTSDVTADGSGRATFAASFPMNLLASQVVTATATDTSDDTSEFAAGIQRVMNFFTVDPCRAVDTRGSDAPGIDGLSVRTFTIAGRCGIPSTAKSVSFNVTIT